jgi:putative spermidine/putrescine transport system permease protein
MMARSQGYARDRWVNIGLGIYFGLILLFLYGPIIVMAIISFQGPQGGMTFPMQGVSLHWWGRLFGERATELGPAIVRTLVVAVETGLIAAAFSVVIAFAYRRRLPGSRVLFPLGVHVVWALPFAFLVMLAVLNRFDPRIEESARDLGASEVRTFFEVVMPIIWPGVLSAALFGFTLSLNEFERSVLATSQNTLPLQLWAMLTVQIIEPDLYALGTLTTLVTFVIVGALFIPTLMGQLRRVSRRGPE